MSYGESRVYKKIEVVGTSPESVEKAIGNAVDRAKNSLDKLSWFEVESIRGHINAQGQVAEYQVVLKIAFELA